MSYKPELVNNNNYRPAGAPTPLGYYVGDYIEDTSDVAASLNVNTITAVGDSITNNSGILNPLLPSGTQNMTMKAYAEVANSLTGHKCKWVAPGPSGPGSFASGSAGGAFALGGIYTEDIIEDGFMAAAVASEANIIVVHTGTNNINRPDTAIAIMRDLLRIWRMATRVGKRVIATTIMPRDASIVTGSKLTELNRLNLLIRENAAREPGVFLCDWHAAMLDAALAAPPTAASAWFTDGLHPNGMGAWRMGSVLAPVLDSIVKDKLTSPDDYLPILATNCLTPNSFALGDVAGVATSWIVTNVGTPTSVTPTKVARAAADILPGAWQQVVSVPANVLTDGWNITITDSTTSDWAVGDVVYAACEIQADAASWDCRALQLDVVLTGTSGVASANSYTSAERLASTAGMQPPPVGGLVLVTPRITVPASITAIRAVLRFYGAGTVRVSRIGVRKV